MGSVQNRFKLVFRGQPSPTRVQLLGYGLGSAGVRVYAGVQMSNPYPNPRKPHQFTPGFWLPVTIPNHHKHSSPRSISWTFIWLTVLTLANPSIGIELNNGQFASSFCLIFDSTVRTPISFYRLPISNYWDSLKLLLNPPCINDTYSYVYTILVIHIVP